MIKEHFRLNNIKARYIPSKEPYTYHLYLPDKRHLSFTRKTKGEAFNAVMDYCKAHTEHRLDPTKRQKTKGKVVFLKEDEMRMILSYMPKIKNTTRLLNKIKGATDALRDSGRTTND